MQSFDYIIIGTGLSGLLMAYNMQADSWFDGKKIALIDREIKNYNDRTWCFWEKNTGEWDDIVAKKWEIALVANQHFYKDFRMHPFHYKMIRSNDFYTKVKNLLQNKSNFTWIQDEIMQNNENQYEVALRGKKETYVGKYVLDSILDISILKNKPKFPYLKQHFMGWFIKTKKPFFDENKVSFMDFSIPQKGNTRFMYVLPTSPTEALVEYTLFSADLLETSEYENAIRDYLLDKGITEYEIVEKEQGDIPMTCFPFHHQNSIRIIKIGSAGGWTKASTGFTFSNSNRKSKELLLFLKTEKNLNQFHSKNRFWWYDAIFLEVLHQHNELGADIFGMLFKKIGIDPIFNFLDEKSTLSVEFKIINSLPKWVFIQALGRVLRKQVL